MPFECASSEQKIKISQFEVTETPYKKTVDGKEVDKIKKKQKTERIYHDLSFIDACSKFVSMKKLYITHKIDVYNDAFHWPKIINSIPGIGEIYHLGYSENMKQQYKFEPQSSHFSKKQFPLH